MKISKYFRLIIKQIKQKIKSRNECKSQIIQLLENKKHKVAYNFYFKSPHFILMIYYVMIISCSEDLTTSNSANILKNCIENENKLPKIKDVRISACNENNKSKLEANQKINCNVNENKITCNLETNQHQKVTKISSMLENRFLNVQNKVKIKFNIEEEQKNENCSYRAEGINKKNNTIFFLTKERNYVRRTYQPMR
ncbi:hypothetical protein EDEG_01030 [Edhazardia aedis USNM 41457]|uniref:Uncharacterized protein n=1 Tax=Edhazardia aedis (strain USNM 41457) TaxID=1003232 RepID=J9DQB0_EDHAE|nr:hypothetical protein EDEG_01030 [Edhazardia aedis USNM 41457]|eukprot:EJW04740.1 hypothetical protein EDEG_01030 [Edhazardia aedis USNM 41457]